MSTKRVAMVKIYEKNGELSKKESPFFIPSNMEEFCEGDILVKVCVNGEEKTGIVTDMRTPIESEEGKAVDNLLCFVSPVKKDSDENSLIVIEQLPVIRERLSTLSAEIDKEVEDALSLVCTEETVKTVKNVRTAMTKKFTELETQRKDVKKAVLDPYSRFEEIYKELVSDKYKAADAQLKEKIDTVENELKKKKEDEVYSYFTELCEAKKIDFISFERAGLNINLSATVPALKKQVKEFIDRIVSDLELIDNQEFKSEIMVEFRHSLNGSQAIMTVVTRNKEIEEQKQRQIAAEAARLALKEHEAQIDRITPIAIEAPTIEQETVQEVVPVNTTYSVSFKVFGTYDELKGLKKYISDAGLKFETLQ